MDVSDVKASEEDGYLSRSMTIEANKSKAERVDIVDTLQRAISIIEKEMAKNPAFIDAQEQTRQHSKFVNPIDVKQICICVNKEELRESLKRALVSKSSRSTWTSFTPQMQRVSRTG